MAGPGQCHGGVEGQRPRSKMQNYIRSCMSALACSSEGVLAQAKTASGKKPERDECALERSLCGSSDGLRLHKNLKEFIVRSSEGFMARAKALMVITRVKVLARASAALLELASNSEFL